MSGPAVPGFRDVQTATPAGSLTTPVQQRTVTFFYISDPELQIFEELSSSYDSTFFGIAASAFVALMIAIIESAVSGNAYTTWLIALIPVAIGTVYFFLQMQKERKRGKAKVAKVRENPAPAAAKSGESAAAPPERPN